MLQGLLSETQSELSQRITDHQRFSAEVDASRVASTDAMALLRSQLATAESERESTLTELAHVRAEMAALKRANKQCGDEIERLTGELDEQQVKLTDADSARRQLKEAADSRCESLQRRIESLEDEKRELNEQIAALEGHLSAADASRKKLMQETASLSVGKAQFAELQHALEKVSRFFSHI